MHNYKKENTSVSVTRSLTTVISWAVISFFVYTIQTEKKQSNKTIRNTHSREAREKSRRTSIKNGIFAGSNNPMWKGGTLNSSFVGWKEARRKVWKRDKTCRVCEKRPYPNRKFDVHRLKARRNGGTNDIKYLVGVHHNCHMKLEASNVKLTRRW